MTKAKPTSKKARLISAARVSFARTIYIMVRHPASTRSVKTRELVPDEVFGDFDSETGELLGLEVLMP